MLTKFLRNDVLPLVRAATSRRGIQLHTLAGERRPGFWHHADLEWMAARVRAVPGDFAEIGVFRGAAFRRLAVLAHEQGKLAHAVDSFRGMDDPGPRDGVQYPKGKFDIGGPEAFAALMSGYGVPSDYYRLWEGYIPECFSRIPAQLGLSLAIIDVDHYEPTRDAIAWAAPRIAPGGILALDDLVPHWEGLAAQAIREFLVTEKRFRRIGEFNCQVILQRRR